MSDKQTWLNVLRTDEENITLSMASFEYRCTINGRGITTLEAHHQLKRFVKDVARYQEIFGESYFDA